MKLSVADNDRFVRLIHSRPDRAIAYLYEHYYDKLVQISERMTYDREASEDIVQEVFTDVWRRSGVLCKQEGFLIGPYLVGMVKKKSISAYYKISQRGKYPLRENSAIGGLMEAEIIRADTYETLRTIVSTLPPRERECVEMRYFREMSIEAIALRLNISKKAVEKNLTSGVKRLRKNKSLMF